MDESDPTASINFASEASVRTFVEGNTYLNNPIAKAYAIPNMYKKVCNEGAFFRSAQNRREKTYWLPGLNAGLHATSTMITHAGLYTVALMHWIVS